MTRISDQTIIDKATTNSVEYYECVHMNINPGYHLTNSYRDITLTEDGVDNTYKALGTLLDFGDIEENVTFEVTGLTITVSGLPAYDDNNESWINRILDFDTNPYTNKLVTIKRVYQEYQYIPDTPSFQSNQSPFRTEVGISYIPEPPHIVEIYKGYIDNVGVKFTPAGESVVSIETKSHWVDFQRVNAQYTNNTTHKARSDLYTSRTQFNTDDGFEYASQVIKDMEWK